MKKRDFACLLAWVGELMREGGLVRRREEGGGNIIYHLFNPKVIFCPAPAPGLLGSALLCVSSEEDDDKEDDEGDDYKDEDNEDDNDAL